VDLSRRLEKAQGMQPQKQDTGGVGGTASVAPAPAILVSVEDRIATVTFNRPDRRNALTLAMWREVPQICARLERDPDVRSVILTGAADCFTAGADIIEFDKVRESVSASAEYEVAVDACCDALAALSKPTIAAIAGYCMGGGCHIAISCDFRYAHPAGTFGVPAARLSIVYGIRGTQKLVSLVGIANAKRILYAGEPFDAKEAYRIGFIDRIEDDAQGAARAFAARLADNAPLSISGAKVLINGLSLGLGALDPKVAHNAIERAAASEDYAEGRRAFAEKRRPQFKGR
jgi:enoyl-CoA hydratase/carnithine racemase